MMYLRMTYTSCTIDNESDCTTFSRCQDVGGSPSCVCKFDEGWTRHPGTHKTDCVRTVTGTLGEDFHLNTCPSGTGLVEPTNNEKVAWFKMDGQSCCPDGPVTADPLDKALLWAYYRNEEGALDSERHYVDSRAESRGFDISEDVALFIPSLNETDSGMYTCLRTDGIANSYTEVKLLVTDSGERCSYSSLIILSLVLTLLRMKNVL